MLESTSSPGAISTVTPSALLPVKGWPSMVAS